jgi:hypothetical protein
MLMAGVFGAAAGAIGALALLGSGLGSVVPLRAEHSTAVAETLWPLAVAYVLLQLVQATPETARQLARPADRDVLRSLGATSGQVLLARLVLPAAGAAIATALGVTALAVPWLGATAEGRDLAGPLLVHVWGVCTGAAALRVLLTGALLHVSGAPRLAGSAGAAVLGGVLGVLCAPLVRGLARLGDGPEQALRRGLHEMITGGRPDGLTALLAPDRVAAAVLGHTAVLGVTMTAAMFFLRRASRLTVLTPEVVTCPAVRRRQVRFRGGPVRLVMRKDCALLLRGDSDVTDGAWRFLRLSLCAGTGATAVALRSDGPLWPVAGAGLLALALLPVLMASDGAMQICGIEAERTSWDLLRLVPSPPGTLLLGKGASSAALLTVCSAPLYTGGAVLTGVLWHAPLTTLCALPLAACATAAGMLAAAHAVPRTESFPRGRISRPKAAGVVEGLVAGALMAPMAAVLWVVDRIGVPVAVADVAGALAAVGTGALLIGMGRSGALQTSVVREESVA